MKKIKITLLIIGLMSLVFFITKAISNYKIRYYLMQTNKSLKHDTITPNQEKANELYSIFYGIKKTEPTYHYSIKEIGEALDDGFSYFTGIRLKNKQINFRIVVFEKENGIRRYFTLNSTDTSNSHFLIQSDQ